MFRLYNTLSRKKEAFKPLHAPKVGIYTCGPTVYNRPHIGNYRTFLWEDLLVRFLRFKGFSVTHVMNLTDVDDKTIRGAIAEHVSLSDFTSKFKTIFFDEMKLLNCVPASQFPAATNHIPEMVSLIQSLLDKGLAYRGPDNSIYFSIQKFPNYGKLSRFKLKKLKEGARVRQDEYEKKQAQDFALWKAWGENDGNVYWDTSLGRGRPGWHIECSAMSMKYLGESFDLHTGGVDNLFPHHENEIAQSEGVTQKPFVKYWLHAKHLLVNGEKMSKSKGNFLTLSDLGQFDPLAIRFALISNHYRKTANFTLFEVQKTQSRLGKINETIQRLLEKAGPGGLGSADAKKPASKNLAFVSKFLQKFESGLDDDLNVPKALVAVNELVKKTNSVLESKTFSPSDAAGLLAAFRKIDSVLGVFSFEPKKAVSLDKKILDLIAEREDFRKQKNWSEADRIRLELASQGIELLDTPEGPKWKKRGD